MVKLSEKDLCGSGSEHAKGEHGDEFRDSMDCVHFLIYLGDYWLLTKDPVPWR